MKNTYVINTSVQQKDIFFFYERQNRKYLIFTYKSTCDIIENVGSFEVVEPRQITASILVSKTKMRYFKIKIFNRGN